MTTTHDTPGPDAGQIPCPVCSVPTRSLKRFSMMNQLLFLGIGFGMKRGPYTACPKCQRRKLLKNAFKPLNILSANIMWPLAVCPYTVILLVNSFIPGHSASIRKLIEERNAAAATPRPTRRVEPDAGWQLWHQDVFDRECPPSIEASGDELAAGLRALWTSYLRSGVQHGGIKTFSRFHLMWRGSQIDIEWEMKGIARLREWVFGPRRSGEECGDGDTALLTQLAAAHEKLLAAGKSAQPIVTLATSTTGRHTFERMLSGLK